MINFLKRVGYIFYTKIIFFSLVFFIFYSTGFSKGKKATLYDSEYFLNSKQIDSDKDGVVDLYDVCQNTKKNRPVDKFGCSEYQLDSDSDGVSNANDKCKNTPVGINVNKHGCYFPDDDLDGIKNTDDLCPNTNFLDDVDINGCSTYQRDSDNDGIKDYSDKCPNTSFGTKVDEKGCRLDIKIKTYPNPVINLLNISLENYDENTEIRVGLYDIKGKLLIDKVYNNQNLIVINTRYIETGLYYLKISSSLNNSIINKRIIINR